MVRLVGWCAALLVAAVVVAGDAAAASKRATATPSLNKANDKLLQMTEPERIATLARAIGHWCIGTEAFPMGIITAGNGQGNAYWSLRCADGTAWAVQLDPFAAVTAIGCDTFKANGAGKECFQKF